MQFYSVDTNTIYPPVLEIQWDDQVFETGSLPPLQTADMFVALDNNPGVFYSESINIFLVVVLSYIHQSNYFGNHNLF